MRWLLPALVVAMLWSHALAQMGKPERVVVAPVEERQVRRTVTLVGGVEPVTRTTLASEGAGLVAERTFDEGQRVEKNAILTRLKVDLLEAELAAATASLDIAKANLDRARADEWNAAQELDRITTLRRQNVGSDKEYRDAATAHKIAVASIAARQAEVAEQAAEVSRLKLLIDKATVKTPLAGTVARRYVEVGQWIQQGDPVAEVVQLDPLFVRIQVPEDAISAVKPGDEAAVFIDALGGRQFTGKVQQILPEAEAASRTFAVKLLMSNPDLAIHPGFFARVTLTLHANDASLVVPRDAVVMRGPAAHVVVNRGGRAAIVPVKRGIAIGEQLVVSGALKPGEQVVVRGNEMLRDGQPLEVAGAGGPPAAAPAGNGP